MTPVLIPTHGHAAGLFSRRAALPFVASLLAALAACGGGGDDGTAPPVEPGGINYPQSVAMGTQASGAPILQALTYTPADAGKLASVTASTPSALLPAGTTTLVAEHTESVLAGLRVACVSGRGDSINVIGHINLGVVAQSAAVLLDARWHAVDAASAWAAAVARGTAWSGWENCGVKPEGAASASSRLVPSADGGYAEDVFDGNPGTTFNVIHRDVAASEVAAMLSGAGMQTSEDPLRPLRLTWRAYGDDQQHVVFIQSGVPVAGNAAPGDGFIALYVPAS